MSVSHSALAITRGTGSTRNGVPVLAAEPDALLLQQLVDLAGHLVAVAGLVRLRKV